MVPQSIFGRERYPLKSWAAQSSVKFGDSALYHSLPEFGKPKQARHLPDMATTSM